MATRFNTQEAKHCLGRDEYRNFCDEEAKRLRGEAVQLRNHKLLLEQLKWQMANSQKRSGKHINPILHRFWNDVVPWVGVIMTPTRFLRLRDTKSPKLRSHI